MSTKNNIVKKEEKIEKLKQELNELPKEQRIMLLEQTVQYRGTLPPPEMLKEFDVIIPDGAERIMKMAETEAKERQENNKLLLKYNSLGLWFAFIVAISVFVMAFILALNKNNVGAGILAGTVLTGVVIAFIKGVKN